MNFYQASNFQTTPTFPAGTNDYDVRVRFTLPHNFNAWETTNPIVVDFEGTTDASFEFDVYEEGNATALQDNAAVSGTGLGSFAENNVVTAGSTLTDLVAGDTVVFLIKLTVTNTAALDQSIIRVGDIVLNYRVER